MRRAILVATSAAICFFIVAIGTVVFGFPPLTETQFLLLVFIAAWCGDVKEKG